MFIVFEGIDGSGTSTQARLLGDNLEYEKLKVLRTREPTSGAFGKLARDVLQHKIETSPEALQLLFCADRADHIFRRVSPAVAQDKVVISERYFYSTIAFGSLHVDQKWLQNVCSNFLKPDLVFYLKVSPETAVKRINKRGNEIELFEKKEILKKVLENYKNALKNEANVHIINGEGAIEDIAEEIFEIFRKSI